MPETQPVHPDVPLPAAALPRAAESWRRTLLMRLGIQGKLIVAFMFMLITALSATCWLFLSQSNDRLEDIMGEQARQISSALALASKPSLASNETGELRQMGQDLLKSRNILFVAFLDRDGMPITMSSRDPDLTWQTLPITKERTMALMQVYQENSPVLGRYAVWGLVWSALAGTFAVVFSLRYVPIMEALAPKVVVWTVLATLWVAFFLPVVFVVGKPLLDRVRGAEPAT